MRATLLASTERNAWYEYHVYLGSSPAIAHSAKNYLDTWRKFMRASTIQGHQPVLVPGILQTPGYTRSLLSRSYHPWSSADTQQMVDHRQWLREHLLCSGAKLKFVIGEGALRCNVGGAAVMAAQLRFLVGLPADQVTLHIGSHEGGIYPGMELVYFIAHNGTETTVYVGDGLESQVHSSPHPSVRHLAGAFRTAVGQVLDDAASRLYIGQLADKFAARA